MNKYDVIFSLLTIHKVKKKAINFDITMLPLRPFTLVHYSILDLFNQKEKFFMDIKERYNLKWTNMALLRYFLPWCKLKSISLDSVIAS